MASWPAVCPNPRKWGPHLRVTKVPAVTGARRLAGRLRVSVGSVGDFGALASER